MRRHIDKALRFAQQTCGRRALSTKGIPSQIRLFPDSISSSASRLKCQRPRQGLGLRNALVDSMVSRNLTTVVSERAFWSRRKITYAGILIILGLAYIAFPTNSYPKEVADLIRKGLRAERTNSADKYDIALPYYLAALEVADKLGMDRTCDEYTGLQIKICDVYCQIGDMFKALLTFDSILTNGLVWMQEDPQRVGFMSDDRVLRYLRVSVRAVELAEQFDKSMQYMPILGLWIETLQRRLPAIYRDVLTTPLMDIEIDSSLPMTPYRLPSEDTLPDMTAIDAINPDLEDSLTLARDYYATLCVNNDRPGLGYQLKNENIKLLQMMKAPLPRILRTQVDIGSAYVMCYEMQASGVHDENLNNKPEMHQYLEIAHQCFRDVISNITNVRSLSTSNETESYTEEDRNDLDIAQSLAVFGLGVIESKLGNYNEAMTLLKEARIRAIGSNFPELADKVKEEWKILVGNMNKDRILNSGSLTDAIAQIEAATGVATNG